MTFPFSNVPELVLVALAISLDSFAAALALGTRVRRRGWLRVAVVFAALGGSVPILGMWMGAMASGVLTQLAEGLGALVLAALGGWFLHAALRPREEQESTADTPYRPDGTIALGTLVLLALGLSSDNLLVGLGLGLQGETTWLLGALTTMSVFGATLVGLWLGRTKRKRFGRVAEGLAGILLIVLAAWLMAGGDRALTPAQLQDRLPQGTRNQPHGQPGGAALEVEHGVQLHDLQ